MSRERERRGERPNAPQLRAQALSDEEDHLLAALVLLDELVNQLVPGVYALLDELLERRQQGVVWSRPTITVTNSAEELLEFPIPLFSLLVINDGAGTLSLRVPASGQSFSLEADEDVEFSFPTAVISDLSYRISSGSSASLRLIGSY